MNATINLILISPSIAFEIHIHHHNRIFARLNLRSSRSECFNGNFMFLDIKRWCISNNLISETPTKLLSNFNYLENNSPQLWNCFKHHMLFIKDKMIL